MVQNLLLLNLNLKTNLGYISIPKPIILRDQIPPLSSLCSHNPVATNSLKKNADVISTLQTPCLPTSLTIVRSDQNAREK